MNYAFTNGNKEGKVDLVKLMITGGVLDAKEKGVPGELKMSPDMVRAVCDKAHADGYIVSAHVESPEGVRVALEMVSTRSSTVRRWMMR